MAEFDFNKRMGSKRILAFAQMLLQIQRQVGFKMSSRGWCYQLEVNRLINKDQFTKVESAINRCRREGILPVDFVAQEEGRQFSVVEEPTDESVEDAFAAQIRITLDLESYQIPDWWIDEEYYIQVIVEKIDLKTLFQPICERYHIPIATSKGWSSINQRAEYARRYREANEMYGCKPVLLYCGDHDPDGLRISDFLRENLRQIQDIYWMDGSGGFDPSDLIIERFGLNADFIQQHGLTWIDNLKTGKPKPPNDLSDPLHPNHGKQYVQDYLSRFGARKCEANVIVVMPEEAANLMQSEIEKWLGSDCMDRFGKKRAAFNEVYQEFRNRTGLQEALQEALDIAEGE